MMMVPYMFNDDLMDDLFNDNWERDFDRAMHSMQPRHMFGKRSANVMKTDVRETKDGYDVFVDLPGFKKEDVNLTIQAAKGLDRDQKDQEGRYIRQERCTGSCARSFYVGENLKPTDVAAKFENGILELKLPKADKQIPEKPTTLIEIQ